MIASKNDRWAAELDSYEPEGSNVIEHPSRLPTHDEIEVRAYEIYTRSGGEAGHCEENWLEAERELLAELRNGSQEDVAVSTRGGGL